MFSPETPYTRLVPGDFLRAAGSNRPNFTCLVVVVNEQMVRARSLMGELQYDFDRQTGMARTPDGDYAITSIEPLPIEFYDVLRGLDRKMRLTLDKERLKLNGNEIAALLFVDGYYAKHPIPRAA